MFKRIRSAIAPRHSHFDNDVTLSENMRSEAFRLMSKNLYS